MIILSRTTIGLADKLAVVGGTPEYSQLVRMNGYNHLSLLINCVAQNEDTGTPTDNLLTITVQAGNDGENWQDFHVEFGVGVGCSVFDVPDINSSVVRLAYDMLTDPPGLPYIAILGSAITLSKS